MNKLTREDLYTLERYAEIRPDFRADVMLHKRDRKVHIGEHATLYFEDRTTMHYQVQEMLRIERIFEPEEIESELDAYNPLIPDGSNWKATFMIEYDDVEERRVALEQMVGIEERVWVRVDGFDPVFAIADEDLERENDDKTSSVHFLRFELSAPMIEALGGGAALSMGIDHPAYNEVVARVPAPTRASLMQDLQA